MTEQDTAALSAEESAYFESRGETALPADTTTTTTEPVVTTEPAAPTELTGQERDEKGKFVPHGALHAEREEHKKTRSELQQIKEQQAILNDRWNTILKAQQAPQEQAKVDDDPEPDPNVDIFAHNQWLGRQLAKERQIREEGQQKETLTKQQQEQEKVIWDTWQSETAQFSQQQPDFDAARTFLSTMRETQLKGLGRVNPQFATEQGRIQQINSELKEIIVAAKQQGISPAQFIYELAGSYGYAPKAADPNPTPAAVSTELPEQLAKVQAAQNASRTVAAAPGGSSVEPDSPEAIANMSEADFAKWLEKGQFKKVMGG